MRRSNFALRLQPSLLEELRKAAELEGVAQTRSSMWQWRKRFPPCVPKMRFAWFPVWLRNKEDFRAVAMRNIERIYDVRPRYAVVSFDIHIPFSSPPQFVL